MSRVLRSLGSFFIVLVAYWTYATVAVPMIDPPADPRRADEDSEFSSRTDGVLADRRVDALRELFPLVSHEHWIVRAEVVQALADRGLEQAVPTILRWLDKEQDDFVRDAIFRALKRLET